MTLRKPLATLALAAALAGCGAAAANEHTVTCGDQSTIVVHMNEPPKNAADLYAISQINECRNRTP